MSLIILITVILLVTTLAGSNLFAQARDPSPLNQVADTPALSEHTPSPYGLIAAAVAFGFGAIGAGIAIANVGSAAMGAIGEKPEIAGQALIFIALAEGLVVFGFITALLILGRA